jgi:hypothetical protein
MYYEVASKLAVPVPGAKTIAVPMGDANSISVTFNIVVFGDDTTVTVELSNDLQNWSTGDNGGVKSAVGSYTFTSANIAAKYVRLDIAGKNSIVTACIYTSRL